MAVRGDRDHDHRGMFLMWLGEQITERGVGNGISMIILSGIVAGLPGAIEPHLRAVSTGEMRPIFAIALVAIVLGVTGFCVFVERAQRRIAVHYAKRQVGRRMYAGQSSHLPFKLNMSGVIPPIFASSLLLFPATIAGFFATGSDTRWAWSCKTIRPPSVMASRCTWCVRRADPRLCFFYTALVFNARETADNLKKSGRLHPGHPSGSADRRVHRQGADAPDAVGRAIHHGGVPAARGAGASQGVPFVFGGTSLLIVVVVAMDFMAQLQAHLMSHHYPGLMKKANLIGYGRRRAGLKGEKMKVRPSVKEDLQELQDRAPSRRCIRDLLRHSPQAAARIRVVAWHA